ncbi:hypothetical protein KRR55_03010 [Paeniglutamicibacter sp. ABSL32-1]|uniref:hypothetical protein n=1 Tax=Paeniglutamicibacter quisquiliarum TaxID=2849498 RepID=UPI001C2CD96F|nr:hypothetical protein [Paeniglutamicibacter quisquiliarum]MBV1778082.1 hypothetical protein [Paeniglutamicibacter quisquiliarum]
MDRVAIVYYQRDALARQRAAELAEKLHTHELHSEILEVASSSAHELVYFDATVLVGPLRFSRMHGLALANAVFGFRPVALLLTGTGDTDRILRQLPRRMRGEVPVFTVGDDGRPHTGIDPLVTWLRAMIGYSGYRAVG